MGTGVLEGWRAVDDVGGDPDLLAVLYTRYFLSVKKDHAWNSPSLPNSLRSGKRQDSGYT